MKKLFKKESIKDTLVNTTIGGAGNVAFDYIWDTAGLDEKLADKEGKRDVSLIKNAIKLIGGAVAGSMVSNKYLRAMTDGFAVVGASGLVSGLIIDKDDDETLTPSKESTQGLPKGTVGELGRMRYGSSKFGRSKSGKIAGDFIGAD